ncbi:MAG: galactosyldiacylglycerol synthase [Anaerolineae bacterium]|nr:galactosyldiacylglycerol synthase [Anaerolineae bacterium]MDW8171811.1 glycosyltransferase [Anaerolineae bacterium]
MTPPKRILFIMSDTGGGHRAAAEAIRDALIAKHGAEAIDAPFLDGFRVSRFPMNYMPEFYPWIVNHSKASWGLGYKLSNSKRRAAFFSATMYLTNGDRFRKFFRAQRFDVVVSVHSVLTRPTLRALRSLEQRPPYITVVTDLVSTHHFWYDRRTERCLVPTQAAYERGLASGLKPEQLRVTGLPVHPRFTQALRGKAAARAELDWTGDAPIVLMVAGGDGMGPLYETAQAIDALGLNCQLAIIAGKNAALKARLEAASWQLPTRIYGFVRNMPTLMEAADILVTKAGPATITEAAIAGLPMILFDAIPGQEEGNVTYVVDNRAGEYAPSPSLVAETVRRWLAEGPQALAERAARARAIANPNAVWDIADEIWAWADHAPIINPRRQRRRSDSVRRR